ncbi:hypothetical protein EZV62_015835 [Acer yangbiense]|uniref:Uncharacterized protein n=1 Tax=Acer yangbiense TaxID=1000413 RepID=A0A5C7HNY4_9ROSI|nr:hypothetical protein EZV62_015835 [Acer yangbiense]
MGFEEIAKLCANMNLMEKEMLVLRLKEGLKSAGMQMLALILVGKVQIHRVSLLCMTKEIGHFLGSMVGVVKEVDVEVSGECSRDFLRVRVVVDIAKPLRRCLRVDVIGDGEETVMILRMESFGVLAASGLNSLSVDDGGSGRVGLPELGNVLSSRDLSGMNLGKSNRGPLRWKRRLRGKAPTGRESDGEKTLRKPRLHDGDNVECGGWEGDSNRRKLVTKGVV